ncbi:MAG: hypothetical protein JWN70_1820 [Planctomycetaceae bacterium]|nr:hypothetical protein [Planctomycetaceae bacterium]
MVKSYASDGIIGGFCERTVPMALLALTVLTTAGCGGRIIGRLRQDHRRPLEFLCLSSAIGWAALSLPLCWLAAAGLFEPGIFGPLACLCSLTFGFGLDGGLSGWDVVNRVGWSRWIQVYRRDRWTWSAFVITSLLIGVTLLWSLGPVWDYDSEMYHLPNAVRLLEQHQLVVDRNEPLSNLPGQAYLWYALGLAAGAEAFPALLVCWATVLTSLLAATIASRWLGVRVGLWTVPVYWSGMIVHAVASTARVEPLYSLMFLTSVALLLEATQRKELPWGVLACCGLCLGTAGTIKYQGFYGWPLIGCWWVWLWCRHREWRTLDTIARVTVMFLIGFAVLAPWWIKNYTAFRNPIYPMFNRAQLDPDSLRNANPHGPHRPHPWNYLIVDTCELFVRPNTFSGPPNQFPHYPFLLLPLLAVVGVGVGRRPADAASVRTFACLAGSYYILSLTLTHELRHMFGMFSLASILVAYVVVEFGLRWRLTVLLPGLVIAAVAFVLIFPGRLFRLPGVIKYASGVISEKTLREQLVPPNFSRVCEWANANTSPEAVILMCWEARTYRLHRKSITDPGWATWKTLFRNRSTPEEIRAYLKKERVDYVLVNAGSLEFNVTQSKLIPERVRDEFRKQRELLVPAVLEPVFEVPKGATKAVSLYRVKDSR